jgi:aromatic-L-amino-acid/L-tryptophan decarboxylase
MATHQCAADAVVQSGAAWISTILLGGYKPALRACITNYRTEPQHIEMLLAALSNVRDKLSAQNAN